MDNLSNFNGNYGMLAIYTLEKSLNYDDTTLLELYK